MARSALKRKQSGAARPQSRRSRPRLRLHGKRSTGFANTLRNAPEPGRRPGFESPPRCGSCACVGWVYLPPLDIVTPRAAQPHHEGRGAEEHEAGDGGPSAPACDRLPIPSSCGRTARQARRRLPGTAQGLVHPRLLLARSRLRERTSTRQLKRLLGGEDRSQRRPRPRPDRDGSCGRLGGLRNMGMRDT